MNRRLHLAVELVSAVLGIALLAIVALTLTGSMAWVVTTGSSMQPTFEAGDVAVVRPATAYAVGDVIAYRNDDLSRIVLHRVVEVRGDTLVTQGDANEWTDSHHPRHDQVLGRLWLHLPILGHVLDLLFRPAVAAGVVFIGTVLVLAAPARQRSAPTQPTPVGP